MENKFEQIVRLYNEACMSVVSSPQKWEAFLRSACRNYKLRFDEQLLVFAQRPEATAVLEIYKWNKLFGRQVVKEAEGIAVIEDYSHIKQRINYYFDIADTKPTKYAKPVPIWEMNEAYETEVIKTLEQTFGITAEGSSLEKTIMSAATSAVEDSLSDYTADLMYSVDNTFLEGLEQDTVVAMYKQTVTNSVAYMLMSRLGLDTNRYFEHSDFEHIVNFNNYETLNAVGYATGKIVKTGLQEISKTIFSLYRNQQITIEESRENGYNKTKEINNGRSNINEHHLQRTVPKQVEAPTGIYAQLRLEYLKEHRELLYYNLLTSFKMTEHLTEVDKRANEMQTRLVDELAKKEGVTEELKAKDMMTWVGKMNNIRDRVREIVLAEVIYA